MKLYKRLAALGAAALMSVSLTACGDTSWVYKTENNTVASGVYLGYLTQNYLGGQGSEDFDKEIKNIWKQKIDGKSYKDYVKDSAAEASKRYLTIADKFDEMGLTLSEEDISNANMQAEFMWNYYGYQGAMEPNGTSLDSYKKIVTSSVKETAIFNAYYDKGGFEEVGEPIVIENMTKNYADINYFELSFKGEEEGSVLPSSEIDALKEKAESYAERINSGESTFNEVKTEYNDELDKAAAEENDTEFNPTKPEDIKADKDTKSLLNKDSTSMPEDFVTAVFDDVNVGKATVITVDTSYYLVVKYDVKDDLENNLDQVKTQILVSLKGDEFEEKVTDWMKEASIEENASAVSRYNPKNIEISK